MSIRSCSPALDVADDTWLAVPPARVAAAVADPRRWATWWPDLDLRVSRDRGREGQQWVARSRVPAGRSRGWRRPRTAWSGSLEVWLEPWGDGVLLHHYARLDPVVGSGPAGTPGASPAPLSDRALTRARDRRVLAWKRSVHALKDELEGHRLPGT